MFNETATPHLDQTEQLTNFHEQLEIFRYHQEQNSNPRMSHRSSVSLIVDSYSLIFNSRAIKTEEILF